MLGMILGIVTFACGCHHSAFVSVLCYCTILTVYLEKVLVEYMTRQPRHVAVMVHRITPFTT